MKSESEFRSNFNDSIAKYRVYENYAEETFAQKELFQWRSLRSFPKR